MSRMREVECHRHRWEHLGSDGSAQFFQCTRCGDVQIAQKGRRWRLAAQS